MTAHAAVIDPTAQIAQTAVIDNAYRPLLDSRQLEVDGRTVIAAGVWIGQYTLIGYGATIGAASIIDDFVNIQARTEIGSRVLVTGRSWIGIGVTVGDDCVIKGHIDDYSRIGTGCRITGDLIHRQLDPTIPWDDPMAEEPSPVVGNGAFVG
ncbi:MAG: hypothetical protein ACRDOB_21145, partial [Streptosporangiaceae bacterium]